MTTTILGKKKPCLVCGSARTELVRKARNMDPKTEETFPWVGVSVCRGCGLIHQNPCLSEKDMDAFYEGNEDKATAAETDKTPENDNRSRVQGLLKLRRPPASLLEVGCSDGAFIGLAREAGYRVTGMDPSKVNCRKAHKRHPDIEVRQCFLNDYKGTETFDVVAHFFVLEHAFEPIKFLRQCRALLKPDGLLYFEIPNVETFTRLPFANNLFIYQHIGHYSPKTVADLLARSGYKMVAVDGRLGRSPKSYGMRVAARVCDEKPAARKSLYALGKRTLDKYFSRRDGLIAKIERKARAWQPLIASKPGPVVIFGSGENGRILNATSLKRCGRPLYFCDNNALVQGRTIDGLRVLEPGKVPSVKPSLVIATSIDYSDDMERQMVDLGIAPDRIVKLYEGFQKP